MEKTLNESQVRKYHKLTSELSASHASMYQYQVEELDLVAKEVDYFIRLLAYSRAEKPKIDPSGLSSKTLNICYQLMTEGILPPFSIAYPKLGMMQNESVSTLKILESLNQESEFLLLDILEENVEEKYFLSQVHTQKLIEKSMK